MLFLIPMPASFVNTVTGPLKHWISVIVVDVSRISDSCGYGVPVLEYTEDRQVLERWVATHGAETLPAYRREKNRLSIDGLPAWPHDR